MPSSQSRRGLSCLCWCCGITYHCRKIILEIQATFLYPGVDARSHLFPVRTSWKERPRVLNDPRSKDQLSLYKTPQKVKYRARLSTKAKANKHQNTSKWRHKRKEIKSKNTCTSRQKRSQIKNSISSSPCRVFVGSVRNFIPFVSVRYWIVK